MPTCCSVAGDGDICCIAAVSGGHAGGAEVGRRELHVWLGKLVNDRSGHLVPTPKLAPGSRRVTRNCPNPSGFGEKIKNHDYFGQKLPLWETSDRIKLN